MSAPTRAELAQQALLWGSVADVARARASSARAALEAQARQELERDGVAPTWRIPGFGTVPLSLSQDRVEVTDEAALVAWVADNYPSEVETVLTVRPAFRDLLLKGLAESGEDCCTADGTRVPGVVFRAGGQPRGVTIRPAAGVKAAAAELAAVMLDNAMTPGGAQ